MARNHYSGFVKKVTYQMLFNFIEPKLCQLHSLIERTGLAGEMLKIGNNFPHSRSTILLEGQLAAVIIEDHGAKHIIIAGDNKINI